MAGGRGEEAVRRGVVAKGDVTEMKKQALCDGEHGNGEKRARQTEEMLPYQERKDHEDWVNTSLVPDDLRVQEICLELMNAHDPREHAEGRADRLRQGDRDDWDRAED